MLPSANHIQDLCQRLTVDIAPLTKFSDLPLAQYSRGEPLPLQQHPAYGLAIMAMGGSALRLLVSLDGNNIAAAIMMQRGLMGQIGFTTLFRGPIWLDGDISDQVKAAVYMAISKKYPKWRWRFLGLQPEDQKHEGCITPMHLAGFRQVMGGFSTAWLDLRPTKEQLRAGLQSKWRNQLRKAEKEKLTVAVGGKKNHQYSWLIEQEAEQRKSRGYQALPAGFTGHYRNVMALYDAKSILSISLVQDREKIAGALFLLHGNSATYHLGWTGEAGRRICGQNLVLFEAMKALKEAGISFLDMGVLNSDSMAGIARFKLGTGAVPHQLSGTWM